MKKSILSFLLVLCLLFSLTPAVMAAETPTEDQVYKSIINMKESYPEGMPWTNDNYYAWNGYSPQNDVYYGGGFGCAGFAFLLSDVAFGTLPSRFVEDISIHTVRVGDILRVNNDGHSVIILEVHEDYIVIAEGNYNSSIHWGRTMSADKVASADYLLTRYPEKVSNPVTITQQPKSVTVRKGETASVTVKAAGDGLTYRWYYKNPGDSGYTYTSSFKSNTYSVSMTAARDGRRVLCKVYDKYGNSVQSNSVTINMNKTEPVRITQQPKSVTVRKGETASVTVKAIGDGLTYRWYYKNPGDSGYTYTSSFKSNTYSVSMTDARDGRRVLCKVYDKYGNSVQSNSVTINMNKTEPVRITQQPKSVTVRKGETASVTVKAIGDGLTYRWYYKNPGDSGYTYTSSFKSNTYAVSMTTARDGRWVLCRVYDKHGNVAQTKAVKLSMK